MRCETVVVPTSHGQATLECSLQVEPILPLIEAMLLRGTCPNVEDCCLLLSLQLRLVFQIGPDDQQLFVCVRVGVCFTLLEKSSSMFDMLAGCCKFAAVAALYKHQPSGIAKHDSEWPATSSSWMDINIRETCWHIADSCHRWRHVASRHQIPASFQLDEGAEEAGKDNGRVEWWWCDFLFSRWVCSCIDAQSGPNIRSPTPSCSLGFLNRGRSPPPSLPVAIEGGLERLFAHLAMRRLRSPASGLRTCR